MKPLVLLQGFYRRGPDGSVPSPGDPADLSADPGVDWWWDHLARQARDLAQAGFTAVWLPPATKGNRGIYTDDGKSGDGYDVFDDYDLGSKQQSGNEGTSGVPTRFGTREQLARCVAVLRACGLDVYLDLVTKQRLGGRNCRFRYVDADGNPEGGRFPKDSSDFHGESPPYAQQDPNVADGGESFYRRIGCDCAPISGRPYKRLFVGLQQSADWQLRALGAQGFRIDNAKGQSTDFLRPFRDFGAMAGKFAVAEVWEGNPEVLSAWLADPAGMANSCSAFDFPLMYRLTAMCNQPTSFDMRYLHFDAGTVPGPGESSAAFGGLVHRNPFGAVTFAENHDTESHRQYADYINQHKWLAYAYILTAEGYPCVFYKDYSEDQGCLGLKPIIDNLIWIHQNIADGSTRVVYTDRDVFAFERLVGTRPSLLVALNKDGEKPRTITVATDFGPNVSLHDYTGNAPDVSTDGLGNVTITIPKNAVWAVEPRLRAGGYVCYSYQGIQSGAAPAGSSITQDYEGAQDLDIKPASDGEVVQVCRIYAAAGTRIDAVLLRYDTAGWGTDTHITVALADPSGTQIASGDFSSAGGVPISVTAAQTGMYMFTVQSFNSPIPGQRHAYTLTATYTAAQTL